MVDENRGLLGVEGFPTLGVFPPEHAYLDGDQLHYTYGDYSGDPAPTTGGMLDAFIRIQEASDVLRFVRKWGPLRLCVHGLPANHFVTPWPLPPFPKRLDERRKQIECPLRRSRRRNYFREPVARWLVFSRAFRAQLNLAAAIHGGGIGSPADWADAVVRPTIEEFWFPEGRARWEEPEYTVQDARDDASRLVWERLRSGGVLPSMTWDETGARLEFWGATFGNLALQLMQAVTRASAISVCSSCGTPYMRQGRRPQAGRRNYCDECGPLASLRDAQRDFRARRRQQDG